MSEHGILGMMVGFVAVEAVILLGYFINRILRKSDHLDGMISATYLRVHRAMTQRR